MSSLGVDGFFKIFFLMARSRTFFYIENYPMKILEKAFSFTYFEPFLAKIGFSVKIF